MEKSKFISILAAGLLLSNLVLVGFIMFGKSGRGQDGHPPPQHHGPRNIIIERLHFSDEQVVAYDKLIHWHRSKINDADSRITAMKNKLYASLNTTADSSQNDSIIAAIGNEQQNIERIHYKHFEDLRDLCTAVQKPMFEALCREMASLFAHPPHKRH